MNWNRIAQFINNPKIYSEWQKLKKYFGKEEVDVLSLIEYQITQNYPRRTTAYIDANNVVKYANLRIPPQFGTIVRRPKLWPSLHDFVLTVRSLCSSHSIYAFICASLFYPHVFLESRTYQKSNEWYKQSDPKWLRFILDRQNRLCKNANMKDGDPFFFLYDDVRECFRNVTANNCLYTSNLFKEMFGYPISEYAYFFRKLAGMGDNGLLFHGSNMDIDFELLQRRKRNILSPVTLYEIRNRKRTIYTHGFCLKELEPGIYYVDTLKGPKIAPFFLLDMPRINMKYSKDKRSKTIEDLLAMGYIPEEDQEKITGLTSFISYKIREDVLEKKRVERKKQMENKNNG